MHNRLIALSYRAALTITLNCAHVPCSIDYYAVGRLLRDRSMAASTSDRLTT